MKELIAASQPPSRRTSRLSVPVAVALICLLGLSHIFNSNLFRPSCHPHEHPDLPPYGLFPKPDDPFRFIPCTDTTLPPALDDPSPHTSWAALFSPDVETWRRGGPAGTGVYLCGYLDVPLDYTNASDARIARLAVTKFQVAGPGGGKSERTLVVNPGGPGGSGTSLVWKAADEFSQRFTRWEYDVLGWDPRGVNASLPRAACFPFDADRDRWALLRGQYREGAAAGHLALADALNEAIFQACAAQLGDLGRFLSTTFVARDVEAIRTALGEAELTGYFVSYGTGIGQTWASMFPGSVGRLVLDGTEYVRDHRHVGGFGYTALDNVTDAWHDGFLGECLNAGPEHCALATPKPGAGAPTTRPAVQLADLDARMRGLVSSLLDRPIPGYTPTTGPSIIRYSALVGAIYGAMYNPMSWPALAQMLSELEDGNSTLAAHFIESWEYDPRDPSCSTSPMPPSTDELGDLVVCADSADAPEWAEAQHLDWWAGLWDNMTSKSWISGNSRFYNVFPCRHFGTYWQPAELYRGHLNHTLSHPILLIAETYDPATPLRNGRRLLNEMGSNARLVVHHGYGHSSRDISTCTDSIASAYLLHGTVPEGTETDCYADEKPYLYGVNKEGWVGDAMERQETNDPVAVWRAHLETMAVFGF